MLDETDDLDALADLHTEKVNSLQKAVSHYIHTYGLAFDHSHANITWKDNDVPISLEVHKCRRDYLFKPDRCKEFIQSMPSGRDKDDAAAIIQRIVELL